MILQSVGDAHLIGDLLTAASMLVVITAFAVKIKGIAEATAEKLTDGMGVVAKSINDHETRLRTSERRVEILWHDSRKNLGRRDYDNDTDEHDANGEDGG